MKRWSTTPVSNIKNTAKKTVIITAAVIFAATAPFQLARIVRADDYDQRIAEIQSQIDQYQSQSQQLNAQADSYQKEVDALEVQKNVIQKQIDLKQAEHDKLVADIAANEKKIADNQDALGDTIANLYISNDISPLEMLASSKNIGDYVDKETYRNTVKDTLATTIVSIKKLKAQLIAQQKD